MSLGLSHGTTGRFGQRSGETLALLVVLSLSIGAFLLAGREAQAEQLPQAQHPGVIQNTVVIDGGVAERVVRTQSGVPSPVEAPPANTSSVGSARPTGSAPPVGSVPPVDPVPPAGSASSVDSAPPVYQTPPTPEPAPALRPEPIPPVGPAPPADQAPLPESTPEPAPPSDPAPEPVTFEENEPPSPHAEQAPASAPAVPESEQEGSYSPSGSLGTAVSSAVATIQSTANILGNLTDVSSFRPAEGEGSIGTVLAGLFSGEQPGLAPVDRPPEDPGSPSGGTGGPSKGTPQPSSPFTPSPAGSSSFSLSGGGQVGPGGVAPLLLCVLVLGLVLLRWDGKLSRAFCELPKPSSALLLPLECPG